MSDALSSGRPARPDPVAGDRPAERCRTRLERYPHPASTAPAASEADRADHPFAVRLTVHLVGGDVGRALAAAQGRAVAALLATPGELEVGQCGEEVSP